MIQKLLARLRDWRRGYTDADMASIEAKMPWLSDPGQYIPVSIAEYRAAVAGESEKWGMSSALTPEYKQAQREENQKARDRLELIADQADIDEMERHLLRLRAERSDPWLEFGPEIGSPLMAATVQKRDDYESVVIGTVDDGAFTLTPGITLTAEEQERIPEWEARYVAQAEKYPHLKGPAEIQQWRRKTA